MLPTVLFNDSKEPRLEFEAKSAVEPNLSESLSTAFTVKAVRTSRSPL